MGIEKGEVSKTAVELESNISTSQGEISTAGGLDRAPGPSSRNDFTSQGETSTAGGLDWTPGPSSRNDLTLGVSEAAPQPEVGSINRSQEIPNGRNNETEGINTANTLPEIPACRIPVLQNEPVVDPQNVGGNIANPAPGFWLLTVLQELFQFCLTYNDNENGHDEEPAHDNFNENGHDEEPAHDNFNENGHDEEPAHDNFNINDYDPNQEIINEYEDTTD